MSKFLNREIYLWQGILIYLVFLGLILYFGYFINSKYFQISYDPITKSDRQMVILQNKKDKTYEDFYQLGLLYYQKGALQEAKEAYIKAIFLNDKYSEAYLNLGLVYLEEKDLDSAEKYLVETLKRDRNKDIARFNLAKIYIEKGNYKDAEKMLEQSKDTYSTSADYFYYQAKVFKNLDRESEAIDCLEMALRFDPEYKEAASELKEILKNLD